MREVQESKVAVDTAKSTVASQLYRAKLFTSIDKDTSHFKDYIVF